MKSFIVVAAVLLVLPFLAAAQENPRLNITLMSCRELQCWNRADIFLLNESAYIDYNSSEKGISYYAFLTDPNGTKYPIIFPNRIISNTTGNYTVEITAWKEGYEERHISRVVQFVEKIPEPEIQKPARLDWITVLGVLAVALTLFVGWRVYKSSKPGKEKPKKTARTRKKR
jgi:hypothetical protein